MTRNYICPVPFSEAVFQIYSLSDAEAPTEKPFWFISQSSEALAAFSPTGPSGSGYQLKLPEPRRPSKDGLHPQGGLYGAPSLDPPESGCLWELDGPSLA